MPIDPYLDNRASVRALLKRHQGTAVAGEMLQRLGAKAIGVAELPTHLVAVLVLGSPARTKYAGTTRSIETWDIDWWSVAGDEYAYSTAPLRLGLVPGDAYFAYLGDYTEDADIEFAAGSSPDWHPVIDYGEGRFALTRFFEDAIEDLESQ